ncbi:MAG: hypothetical protein HY619_00585 [Thaumarchaeota archaeon]|nr:hypothetical protein [Nitrososphaerota archaeon]
MESPRRGRKLSVEYMSRGIRATVLIIINYTLFFLVPTMLYNLTGQLTPSVETTITSYFAAIAALTVIRIMLKGHALSVASGIALGFVQALFIYIVTDGGVLTLEVSGLSVTLEFQPLLYLMMTPPLLGTVRQFWDYVSKSASQPVNMIEVVGE